MFVIYGTDNVPLLQIPGSELVLANCMKTICEIVKFQVKIQVSYDAKNVVWEPMDTWSSVHHSWLRMFSRHFPSGIGYLLSLKTILLPRTTQQGNTSSKSTKLLSWLFSKSTSKENGVTDVDRVSSLLALNTFHALR